MVMNLFPTEDEDMDIGPRTYNRTMAVSYDRNGGDEDEDPPIEPRWRPRWVDPNNLINRQEEEELDRGMDFSECGKTKYMDAARIVGGDEADLHQFPWMVALRTDWGIQFCGGTILNERV